jgi:hypothetical protein
MSLDIAEDEVVEDAFVFKDEVRSNYAVDIDQRLREFPSLSWRQATRSSGNDPNLRPGFVEKR